MKKNTTKLKNTMLLIFGLYPTVINYMGKENKNEIYQIFFEDHKLNGYIVVGEKYTDIEYVAHPTESEELKNILFIESDFLAVKDAEDLSYLKEIVFCKSRFTEDNIKNLPSLDKYEHITICISNLKDYQFDNLFGNKNFPNLISLNIEHNKLTNSSINTISSSKFDNLKDIYLFGNKITTIEWENYFSNNYPQCTIHCKETLPF